MLRQRIETIVLEGQQALLELVTSGPQDAGRLALAEHALREVHEKSVDINSLASDLLEVVGNDPGGPELAKRFVETLMGHSRTLLLLSANWGASNAIIGGTDVDTGMTGVVGGGAPSLRS